MGNCLKRSFELGFAYAGIKEKVPNISWDSEMHELAEKYNLKCSCTAKQYSANNDPVLVMYEDSLTHTDSIHHAVFCSDVAPCLDKHIKHIVYGWRELKESRKLINKFKKFFNFVETKNANNNKR